MSAWLLTWSSIQHICHFATDVYSSSPSPRWPGWQHLYFSHHSDETNSLLILPALIWVSWHTSLFLLETVLYCLWMNQRVHEWKAGVAGEMLTEVIRSPPLNVMLRCYSTLQHGKRLCLSTSEEQLPRWLWLTQNAWMANRQCTATDPVQSNLCIQVLPLVEQRRLKVVMW